MGLGCKKREVRVEDRCKYELRIEKGLKGGIR